MNIRRIVRLVLSTTFTLGVGMTVIQSSVIENDQWAQALGYLKSRDALTPTGHVRYFSEDHPPGADDPSESLMLWWEEMGQRYTNGSDESECQPDTLSRDRLLCIVEKYPEEFKALSKWFEHDEQTRKRLMRLAGGAGTDRVAVDAMKTWLGNTVRQEEPESISLLRILLVADVTRMDEDTDFMERDNGLARDLLQRDRTETVPLLHAIATSVRRDPAQWAQRLLLSDAIDHHDSMEVEHWRVALQAAVMDRSRDPRARFRDLFAVSSLSWPQRQSWLAEAIAARTFGEMGWSRQQFDPELDQVLMFPDAWIPILTELLAVTDREWRNHIVACLAQFTEERSRADALRPLLPWLRDPKWAVAAEEKYRRQSYRYLLMKSLVRVDLPECIPYVLEMSDNDYGPMRNLVAGVLGHYHARAAIPMLAKALESGPRFSGIRGLVRAFLACGGVINQDWQAKAIESAVRSELLSGQCGPYLDLAEYLSGGAQDDEALASRLLARAESLRLHEPDIAQHLENRIRWWPMKAMRRILVRDIGHGEIYGEMIDCMLKELPLYRADCSFELGAIASGDGPAAALAAVMLGDQVNALRLLSLHNEDVSSWVLVAARSVAMPLPISVVADVAKDPHQPLGRLVDEYLESDDRPIARAAMIARHPDEMYINGADRRLQFQKLEERLRERMRQADHPNDIFALLSFGPWGRSQQYIIENHAGHGILFVYLDADFQGERVLARQEFSELREFIAIEHCDDLPPCEQQVCDGMQREYVQLSPRGGRRVFMNNPNRSHALASIYHRLTWHFQHLDRNLLQSL